MASTKGSLCVTVDNLASAMYVGQGVTNKPDPNEPGLAVGLPRLLAMLRELEVRATFFVEGWNGIHHPRAIEDILGGGHEVGLHGWVHENWAPLPAGRKEALLWDGTAALRLAGADPRGFRAPGGARGEDTERFLRDLDYFYDSSVVSMDTHTDGAVSRLPGGVINVPWNVEMIDQWVYHLHPDGERTPAQLADEWGRKIDQAGADGRLITFIVHPRTSFLTPERADGVRAVLARALESPNLRLVTGRQAAEQYEAAAVTS